MLDQHQIQVVKKFVSRALQQFAFQLRSLEHRLIVDPKRAQNYAMIDKFLHVSFA